MGNNAEVESGRRLTIEEFQGYAEPDCAIWPRNGFCGKLQRLVTRNLNPTPAESIAAWKRVAYANFVQELVGTGARQRPSRQQWKTGQPALDELVNALRPHVVLVLGAETWNHISHGRSASEAAFVTPRNQRDLWLIPYEGGEAMSTWVYHPSTNYDSIGVGIGVFNELLERETATREARGFN